MKRCPNCSQSYDDPDLNFCVMDGAPLRQATAEPTLVLPPPVSPPQTSKLNSRTQPTFRSGVSPLFAYATVGLVALLIGGGVVAWFRWDTKTSSTLPQNTGPLAVTATPANSNDVKVNSNGNVNQGQTYTAPERTNPTLTVESVRSLMSRWEAAQDNQDPVAYESCYDYSFQGILRTTAGKVNVYGLNEWMKTRRRLLSQAGGVQVEVRNMQIRIAENTATVEFDQEYRSGSYGDWGPKIVRIKATPQGPKIIYEELKASYPL